MSRIAISITIGLLISRTLFPDSYIARPTDGPAPWARCAGALHSALRLPQHLAPGLLGPVVRALHAEAAAEEAKAIHRAQSVAHLEARLRSLSVASSGGGGSGGTSARGRGESASGGHISRSASMRAGSLGGGLPTVAEAPEEGAGHGGRRPLRGPPGAPASASPYWQQQLSPAPASRGSRAQTDSGLSDEDANAISVFSLDGITGLADGADENGDEEAESYEPRSRGGAEAAGGSNRGGGAGGLVSPRPPTGRPPPAPRGGGGGSSSGGRSPALGGIAGGVAVAAALGATSRSPAIRGGAAGSLPASPSPLQREAARGGAPAQPPPPPPPQPPEQHVFNEAAWSHAGQAHDGDAAAGAALGH